uniref:Uncharacterized protein n=1 Tax=Ananas comosus var. bracteatus TaxID=296719 RepID=A0A6V7PLE3_ANACO|nr:unnamed protein product [Ananas comosus var. bracteatus]
MPFTSKTLKRKPLSDLTNAAAAAAATPPKTSASRSSSSANHDAVSAKSSAIFGPRIPGNPRVREIPKSANGAEEIGWKNYLAKVLHDLEVENGENAPRIHAMDDYFMIEVEKVEDNDGNKSSSSFRGKKQSTKKAIEYCYEPEMYEVMHRILIGSIIRQLTHLLLVCLPRLVDDCNLRVADFAQFWAIEKPLETSKKTRIEKGLLYGENDTLFESTGLYARNSWSCGN